METRGAFVVGGIVGIVAALISTILVVFAFVPLCGCLAGFANYAVPAGAGLAAGLIAALRADWSAVEPDEATGAGVGLGLRAGATASAISGLAFFLLSFLSPIVMLIINTLLYGSSDQLLAVLMGSLVSMGISIAVSLGVAVTSTLVGLGLGAASGAIVGSSKANAG